jgi:hypothetical protein
VFFSHILLVTSKCMKPAVPHAKIDKSTTYSDLFEAFIGGFPERSQIVLRRRFGIGSGKPETLDAIGQGYGITRERVRQIMEQLLRFIRTELRREGFSHPLIAKAEAHIAVTHGVAKLDVYLDALASNEHDKQALYGLLHAHPHFEILREDDAHHTRVTHTGIKTDEWEKIRATVEEMLKDRSEGVSEPEFFAQLRSVSPELSDDTIRHYLSLMKAVAKSSFGAWGKKSWSDIEPKGTRERALIVLRKEKKALHYREIARLIDEYGLNQKQKKTHFQTVHNELIKHKDFVLVGRGMYALREWGHENSGTVRDVIDKILRTAGKPMNREDIIAEVLRVRQAEPATVAINLNTHFAKVGRKAYTIKEV